MKAGSMIAGRYEVVNPLGRGGSGTCYLVKDRREEGALRALKVVRTDESGGELEKTFLDECELLRRLSHPHVARLVDFGREVGFLYNVSEYVEGEPFDLACRSRDWNAVFTLIVQAAWALDYLYTQGIVHRDLKPDNVLVGKVHIPGEPDLNDRLVLKIIDFGLAVDDPSRRSTKPVGTLPYMAPEILAGRPYDHRSDLYSWGVVLYQTALGRLPFSGVKDFSRYLECLSRDEVDLSPLVSSGEIPEGILALLRKLLPRNPDLRLQDARQIIRLLNEVEGENFPLASERISSERQASRGVETEARRGANAPEMVSPDEALKRLLDLVRSGRRDEAWAWAEAHLGMIDGATDREVVEKYYGAAGYVLIDQGNYAVAEVFIQRMESHPVLRGGFSIESALLRIQLAYRRGDLVEAGRLLNEVPPGETESATPERRARLENYAGLVAQAAARFEASAGHFERAAEWSERSGRRDHQLSALGSAAALLQEQGRWLRAYAVWRRAEALARELDHRTHLANVLNNLGNLFLYFGRLRESEAALTESLALSRKEGGKPLVSYNLYLLTSVEEAKGNWERVAGYLDEALRFAEDLGESQPILQAELARGHFLLGRRETRACEEAITRLRTKAAGSGREDYRLQADWLEARLRIQEGSFSRFPVGAWLRRVKEDLLARHLANDLWQVALDEGDLAKAQGDLPRAKASYEEAIRTLDEIVREVPEEFQKSFWRDRKKEKLREALQGVEKGAPEEIPSASPVSFEKWASLNRRLLLHYDIETLLGEILDAAISLTDAERGFVILSDNQNLDIRAARNLDQQTLEGEEGKISRTIAQEVLRKGETTMVLDAQEDERFSQAASVHALELRSVLCVPLKAGSRTIGLVYLDNRFRRGVFRKDHLPLLIALADQASLTLEHARLHRENRERIVELERSRETIQKLNAQLERELLTTANELKALGEGMRREHEETSLRYSYDQIIGRSPKLQEVLKILDRVVDSPANVYLHGESGTGKELFARALHFNSPRKDRPFVSENCAALAENLLESELFGHVRGAFTGADRDRLGLFHMAHMGTLFLDEVGEMSASMQAKLLRVLQEGEVRQVGGKEYRKVDVRVVSASNKDLKKLVSRGAFREDLYYRLVVVRLNLPPLRERREDLPLLFRHFLEQGAAAAGVEVPRVARAAMKVFLDHAWPGNIRELQNEVSRLIALRCDPIVPEMISPDILGEIGEAKGVRIEAGLDGLVSEVEKKAILQAMEQCRGNKVKVARALKMGRKTLYAKLRLHKIDRGLGKGVEPRRK